MQRPALPWLPASVAILAALALASPLVGALAMGLALREFLRANGTRVSQRIDALVLALPAGLLAGAEPAAGPPVAAALLALGAAAERRHRAMAAWSGAAVALGPATAFLLPWLIALLIARRVPLRDWLATPATALPVLLLAPIWAGSFPTLRFTAWAGGDSAIVLAGLAAIAGIGWIAFQAARLTAVPLGPRDIAATALAPVLIATAVLPGAGPATLLLAAVLAAAAPPTPARRALALAVQFATAFAALAMVSPALSGYDGSLSILLAGLGFFASRGAARGAVNDNPQMERGRGNSWLPANYCHVRIDGDSNSGKWGVS